MMTARKCLSIHFCQLVGQVVNLRRIVNPPVAYGCAPTPALVTL